MRRSLRPTESAFAAVAVFALLSGCQTASGPGQVHLASADGAGPTMDRITRSAAACWSGSDDRAFRAYRLAPELDSYTGRPRLLLVPAHTPQSRPLAVIQAQGSPAKVEVFGPLMNAALGNRIKADVVRWTAGNTACGTA